MADFRSVVTIPQLTGVPEDVTVNTFSIRADDVTALAAADTAIVSFYNGANAGGSTIAGYLSHIMDRGVNACTIKHYDRAGAPGDPPVTETFWTLGAEGEFTTYPPQVALVMSFAASVAGAGTHRARRRGRIYLGSFHDGLSVISSGAVRPIPQLLLDVKTAGARLLAASLAAATWKWQVWSSVDHIGRDVVSGFCDDRWDTQRRRLEDPTSRQTF